MGLGSERRRLGEPFPEARRPPGEPEAAVVVYFGDDVPRLYQLWQWLPVFERLDGRHRVLIMTRHPRTHAEVSGRTPLRCGLARTLAELSARYAGGDHKVILYVNNSMLNFQSLMARTVLHLHVNHGESDKICMVSNQVKAYDRVLVAGEAAVRRHRSALIGFDERRLVRIGRPQLDLRPPPVLPPTDRRTVLYAPTWEGENAGNNYTSIDRHGPAIVSAALAVPDVRAVYRPHPRVAGSTDRGVMAGHRRIVRLLEEAAARDPAAGHRVESGGDVHAVFPGCDVMITDVSSVGVDFLYLHTGKPLFVVDRYDDRPRLHAEVPVSRCADVVDSGTVGTLTATLAARLRTDELRAAREAVRRFYFGDIAVGESTELFLAAIDDAVRSRDRLIGQSDSRLAREDHFAGVEGMAVW